MTEADHRRIGELKVTEPFIPDAQPRSWRDLPEGVIAATLSPREFYLGTAERGSEICVRVLDASGRPWGGKTSCGPPILMMQTS